MEQKLDLILNELKNLKQSVDNLDQRVCNIESEQNQIKQAVIETNEDAKQIKQSVKHLEQIQLDQQRIIDLLSARSIQHEAELKRIK